MSEVYSWTERQEALKECLNNEQILKRDNNRVCLEGEIYELIQFDHVTKEGRKINKTTVLVERLSGNDDLIPLLIPEDKLSEELKADANGKRVRVYGEFRSYNFAGDDGKRHVKLRVFVHKIEIISGEQAAEDKNIVYLEGKLCKTPVVRMTPLGRVITDLIIAVPKNKGKSDFIPCIAWGENAWETRLLISHIKFGETSHRTVYRKFSFPSIQEIWLGWKRSQMTYWRYRIAQSGITLIRREQMISIWMIWG